MRYRQALFVMTLLFVPLALLPKLGQFPHPSFRSLNPDDPGGDGTPKVSSWPPRLPIPAKHKDDGWLPGSGHESPPIITIDDDPEEASTANIISNTSY